jgi:hypothetical protein
MRSRFHRPLHAHADMRRPAYGAVFIKGREWRETLEGHYRRLHCTARNLFRVCQGLNVNDFIRIPICDSMPLETRNGGKRWTAATEVLLKVKLLTVRSSIFSSGFTV